MLRLRALASGISSCSIVLVHSALQAQVAATVAFGTPTPRPSVDNCTVVVPIRVSVTGGTIQESQFVVNYDSACARLTSVELGSGLGAASIVDQRFDLVDAPDFPIAGTSGVLPPCLQGQPPPPPPDLHALVRISTSSAPYTGNNIEVVRLVFRLECALSTCRISWDRSNATTLPPTYVRSNNDLVVGGSALLSSTDACAIGNGNFVRGRVAYYTDGTPTPRPIPGVTVRGNQGQLHTQTSNATGNYSIGRFNGDQPVTVTASRNALDGFAVGGSDAVILFRHDAMLVDLDDNQRRAGDVTSDGQVNQADALAVARWLAFIDTGAVGAWAFDFHYRDAAAAENSIALVLACLDDTLDVRGFVRGDVNGSWNLSFEKSTATATLRLQTRGRQGNTIELALARPEAVAAMNEQPPQTVESLVYSLRYDAAAFKYVGSRPAAGYAGATYLDNPRTEGEVHGTLLDVAGTAAADGDLVLFRFEAIDPRAAGLFELTRLWANDERLPLSELALGTAAARLTLQAGPNPFNPRTRIRYSIPAESAGLPLALGIYDARGRLVRQLVQAPVGAGTHELTWDGSGSTAPASAGTYYVQLHYGDTVLARKLTLVK